MKLAVGSRRLTCIVCSLLGHTLVGNELPEGWAEASHDDTTTGKRVRVYLCSARCAMEYGESDLAIAALWPADATPEQEAKLREREDEILKRSKGTTPVLAGSVRGGIFRAREQRADAREGKRKR